MTVGGGGDFCDTLEVIHLSRHIPDFQSVAKGLKRRLLAVESVVFFFGRVGFGPG